MFNIARVKIGLRGKIVLLILQILLPFVLYLAVNLDSFLLKIGAGSLLVLSLLVLVLFG